MVFDGAYRSLSDSIVLLGRATTQGYAKLVDKRFAGLNITFAIRGNIVKFYAHGVEVSQMAAKSVLKLGGRLALHDLSTHIACFAVSA